MNFYFIFFISLSILILVLILLRRKPQEDKNSKEEYIIKEVKHPIIEDSRVHSSYKDLLNTQEWKDKRNFILYLRDYKCEWCSSTKCLQIHHKVYYQYPNNQKVFPWQYPENKLMCLCDKCHKKYHQKYKVKTYYVSFDYEN